MVVEQRAIPTANPTCFDVFRQAAMWVMTFAVETGRSGRHVELGGFELSLAEMEAIQLPIRDILVAMGGGRPPANRPPLDLKYWRTIIHQFSVCDDDNHIQHLFPGNPIPEYAKIHTVEFAKGVGNVPFEYIVSCIEQTARLHGMQENDLLFSYRGNIIKDANTLFCEITAHPCDLNRISNQLERWRAFAKRRIEAASAHIATAHDGAEAVDGEIPMPDDLRGRILPSKVIGDLLKRTRKTLRLWERQGHGTHGKPWPVGVHVTRTFVIYDLEKIWKAVSFYLDRNFNHSRCWITALRQGALSCENPHYSLLDELIKKETHEEEAKKKAKRDRKRAP